MPEQWVFPASTLDHSVDGDTFYARVSRLMKFGFHIDFTGSAVQKFRVNGCNSAPDSTASGKGAAARLLELLSMGPFTLTSVGPYKFGDEWMAEVLLSDGRRLTDVMITEQWAAPWNGQGPQPVPPWPRTV